MKKVIVEFSKLNDAILDLLVNKYPDGYGKREIIEFKNSLSETIQAVEVRTEETIYLVKIGKRLMEAMEDYSDLYANDEFDEESEVDFDKKNLED